MTSALTQREVAAALVDGFYQFLRNSSGGFMDLKCRNAANGHLIDAITAALADAAARAVPEGYVVVPKEPTQHMRTTTSRAAYDGSPIWVYLADAKLDVRFADAIYRAMLEAAPAPHDAAEE